MLPLFHTVFVVIYTLPLQILFKAHLNPPLPPRPPNLLCGSQPQAHSCQHESLITGYKYTDSLKKDLAVSLNIPALAMSKSHSDWS